MVACNFWPQSGNRNMYGRAPRGLADRSHARVVRHHLGRPNDRFVDLGGVPGQLEYTYWAILGKAAQCETIADASRLVTARPHLMDRPNKGSRRVLVIGAGTRLLSAMTYYTLRLTNALSSRFVVAFIPMRQLIPTFLYPGRSRVGSVSTRLELHSDVTVFEGVDWFWGLNLARDLRRLRQWQPDLVIFEW